MSAWDTINFESVKFASDDASRIEKARSGYIDHRSSQHATISGEECQFGSRWPRIIFFTGQVDQLRVHSSSFDGIWNVLVTEPRRNQGRVFFSRGISYVRCWKFHRTGVLQETFIEKNVSVTMYPDVSEVKSEER
ncbi:UNVERIFIED_CONTAM: hypothetical protein NCL1_22741 [Trichonephila clavipes]